MNNVVMMFPSGEQEKNTSKIRKLKPFQWIENLLKKHKDNQDELTRKKIDFLVNETYGYYLTLIINGIIESQEIDIHPDLYLAGIAINSQAKSYAEEAVVNIVKQGRKRINECYTNRLKELKSAGIKPAKNIFIR